jgi:hypothetical protein
MEKGARGEAFRAGLGDLPRDDIVARRLFKHSSRTGASLVLMSSSFPFSLTFTTHSWEHLPAQAPAFFPSSTFTTHSQERNTRAVRDPSFSLPFIYLAFTPGPLEHTLARVETLAPYGSQLVFLVFLSFLSFTSTRLSSILLAFFFPGKYACIHLPARGNTCPYGSPALVLPLFLFPPVLSPGSPPFHAFGSFPLPEHTHTRARAGTLAPYGRQPILSSPSGFLIEAYSSYSSYSLSGERSERRSRSGWAGVPSWKDHTVASFEHSSRTGASFLSFHPGFLPRTRPPWLSSPPKLPTCPQVVRELKRLTGG